MMIVLGIIAILISLSAWSFTVQKQQVEVRQSARRFRTQVERARTLAISASAHIERPTFQDCNGNPELRVTVDPANGTYQVPVGLRFANGGADMIADCETVDVVAESGGRARLFTQPGGPVTFAFTASGRLDPAFQTPVFVRFERLDETGGVQNLGMSPAYRVLPSGVLCTATDPNGTGCFEDPP